VAGIATRVHQRPARQNVARHGDARQGDTAQYAKRLNAVVAAASRARRALGAELAKLDLRNDIDLARIARVAWRCSEVFDEARFVARAIKSPPGAEVCTIALRHWLEAQLAACDALARAAGTKDRDHVRTAIRLLREGNAYAHQFNNARRLVVERLAA
jgi:hypothetical protein